jgi:hypothetical protein
MRSRQGLGPCFQALASATGWMRAMTPSPMRTMAAKCFARVGVVISIYVRSGAGWGRLPGRGTARRDCGGAEKMRGSLHYGLRPSVEMTARSGLGCA